MRVRCCLGLTIISRVCDSDELLVLNPLMLVVAYLRRILLALKVAS